MGLNELDGMDTPDNLGGRPTKEKEKSKRVREVEGHPHTMNKESADWWRVKFNKWKDEADNIWETIKMLADDVSINPITVRKILEKHDIYHTNWDEYVKRYPIYEDDARIPGNEISGGDSSDVARRLDDVFGESSSPTFTESSDDDDDNEPSEGLSSLM